MKNIDQEWLKFSIGPEVLPIEHLTWRENDISKYNINKVKEKLIFSPIPILTAKGVNFTTNRNQLFFRTFYFVDFIELKKFNNCINKNKDEIIKLLKKVDEKEKISQYQIFDENNNFVNLIELKAIGINPKKTYIKDTALEIERSSIYKFSNTIDVSNFFDSIYTHSIGWTGLPKNISKEMDEYMIGINGNMTKGIPTGPIASKIFSEIILSQVMIEINELINENVHVHRFADDFTIYFDTDSDFDNVSKKIAKILNKYKLSINKEKFENNYTFKSRFKTIKPDYNSEEKWSIIYDQIKIQNKSNDVEKILLNEISKISDEKTKISFYKFILKSFNKEKSIKFFGDNNNLLKLFLNFSINFIAITDASLNIPFIFLSDFMEMAPGHILIINKIKKLYKETDSEMKKIFLFDLIFRNSNDFEGIDFKEEISKLLKDEKYLHISQLLESKKIQFKDLIKRNIKRPTKNFGRISKEWILWIYSEEKQIKKIEDNAIEEKIQKWREIVKAFNYCDKKWPKK